MKSRPDLLADNSPEGLEIFQLTHEEGIPASHVYMEAQIFTPDSRRFVLHRAAHAHGSDRLDPRHRYLLCDLEDRGRLSPLTGETGATAPSVSPDGVWLYYFVDETRLNGGRLLLKRVRLDGSERETLSVLDNPLEGVKTLPTHLYPLSTISSDGQRIAISAFFGDGQTENAPWGLMVFDITAGEVHLILSGPSWCNLHPQYSRSFDPEAARDILIQENHGNICSASGECARLTGGDGADIHVIRDDGENFRNMPWGRDGNEFCQGHQCWRGRSVRAITSTSTRQPSEDQIIEGEAASFDGHVGIRTPGGIRNDLSRSFSRPCFFHFATDIAGNRLITDSGPSDGGGGIYIANLPRQRDGAMENTRLLLHPRCSWRKDVHIHPFLSPDGSTGFFNSDESGRLQAYMVRGL